MLIASDGLAHLMAHSVSASAGPVQAQDGPRTVVQMLFHYGWASSDEDVDLSAASQPVHDTRFVDPACLRRLIFELSSVADQLGV